MDIQFKELAVLWKKYNKTSTELVEAMGGTSNEVGEFAELLVANYYKGKQLPASCKSADVETKEGKLIQVKSRKLDKIKSTSLNVFRSWDFDVLVVVIFDKQGGILKAIELNVADAKSLAKSNKHQNGHILTTNKYLLEHINAVDLTKAFQSLLKG
ncbi:DUF6998 domain-containing protein [Myroides sp. TSA_177.3]|uniref:DUF6998 domain-containing protein n=1 Tax=Myroides sp. TSA_177.3 TaxID=3415650 RepID=UPI00404592AA